MSEQDNQGATPNLLGVDTGGTFTDFIYLTPSGIRVHKVLSTPHAPHEAILTGIADLGIMPAIKAGRVVIVHGTTVATNATLTGSGARTAYITNRGLKDVLEIGRQTRTDLYSLKVEKPTIDVAPELTFEVNARISATGEIVSALTEEELQQLKQDVLAAKPEAVAINLLFSFIDDRHEREIESLFQDALFTSRSSTVLPEYREYERGLATWVNAWLGPLIKQYLKSLQDALSPSPVAIMQSSGLTIAADQAANKAVNLLLSGPVGGLSAALQIGRIIGTHKLMTFDMGGTSTDVSLLEGKIRLTGENHIAGLPIAIPMADIHTIGAGGGSIAFVDEGGLLKVGPKSAGADPGPACYGRGGNLPTVTDANLILNRLDPTAFLGGRMTLDRDASIAAMEPLCQALSLSATELAAGIVEIANEHMAQALRAISVEKGFDPREYTLVCFGGAGGLHLCDLAERLEMRDAIVPIHSGILSALGLLATRPGREVTRTHRVPLLEADNIEDRFAEMEAGARVELAEEGVTEVSVRRSLDLRYQGQTFTLNVPYNSATSAADAFNDAHKSRYGHNLERDIELVNLKVHLEAAAMNISLPGWAASPGGNTDGPFVAKGHLGVGESIKGPLSITEQHSTTYVAEGWQASLDRFGDLLLSKVG